MNAHPEFALAAREAKPEMSHSEFMAAIQDELKRQANLSDAEISEREPVDRD